MLVESVLVALHRGKVRLVAEKNVTSTALVANEDGGQDIVEVGTINALRIDADPDAIGAVAGWVEPITTPGRKLFGTTGVLDVTGGGTVFRVLLGNIPISALDDPRVTFHLAWLSPERVADVAAGRSTLTIPATVTTQQRNTWRNDPLRRRG